MSDLKPISRKLFILSHISDNPKGRTVDQIRRFLDNRTFIDVTKKTIKADIDDLSESFGVSEEKTDKGTYYMCNKTEIERLTFTPHELLSLYFMKEIISNYDAIDLGETANEIIEKIISSIQTPNKKYINSVKDKIRVNPSEIIREKSINGEILNVVRDAVSSKKMLWIKYHAFNDDKVTEREFEPYLLEISEGCYHVHGLCHLRNDIRDFRVSRIMDVKILEKSFTVPDNFEETYKGAKFDKLVGSEEMEMKLVFEGFGAKFVKEYEADKADRIEEIGDEKLLFYKKTTVTDDILPWILSFGGYVEVLEPENLRREHKWEVERMYYRYRN